MLDETENPSKMEPNFKARGLRFDRTITAGNVMMAIAGIVAGMSAYVDYRLTTDRLEMGNKDNRTAIVELQRRADEQARVQQQTNLVLEKLTTILEMEHRKIENKN